MEDGKKQERQEPQVHKQENWSGWVMDHSTDPPTPLYRPIWSALNDREELRKNPSPISREELYQLALSLQKQQDELFRKRAEQRKQEELEKQNLK